jgi:predicted NAD/FAD-binding protein
MRIAIIGTGVSGSVAARLLSTRHEVTVFEANDYAGGHANTVDVAVGGQSFPVDTGFMVFNRRTYPNFCRLLEMLEIPSQPSDMSLSVRCAKTGLEYQGSSLNGLFAQRTNLLRPSFLKMLTDILRFNRRGMQAAASGELHDGRTVGEFLHNCRVGRRFVEHYLTPMAAAIWSSNPREILEFPAEFMIGFFANHGLMQLRGRPQWRTIVGGSRKYVAALLEPLREQVRYACPVLSVARSPHEVHITSKYASRESFDEVVFACHADQALRMLVDASSAERQILSAFPYQPNEAVLHTDTALLPRRRRAWASWNYHLPRSDDGASSVTYDLSRLQNHASQTPLLLTLNAKSEIDSTKIIRTFNYSHPAYARDSLTAQKRHREISGRRKTHYCGAYWGYGFHEDGVNSAVAVAAHFGIELSACTAASTKEPSPIAVVSR